MHKYLWSVATGNVNPLKKKSRIVVDCMRKQKGLVGVHPTPNGTLWLFDSENNAKGARNMARTQGIICGENICRFKVEENGIVFDDPNFEEK